MIIIDQVWLILFRDHIHTDVNGKLAIFASKSAAQAWIDKWGTPDCGLSGPYKVEKSQS